MATLQELYNLWHEGSDLRARVAAACAKASNDVLNEDAGTANHANRLVWARTTLMDIDAMATRMFWAVISNATIAAAGNAATDNDIQWVVNSWIDSFANALAT